eukprot:1620114-Pyramimonas_sp.AAC.1
MLVAPEHIKALAPDDVWFPNGRGEIGQAVAELNGARGSLEQEDPGGGHPPRAGPARGPARRDGAG